MLTSIFTPNRIYKQIPNVSRNDPNNPEFPFRNPKFPATPTYQIKVPGFNNVWLKDESFNPTWTHKDRMAREIIVTYKDFLHAQTLWINTEDLPHMSLISSWSAAYAIQSALNQFHLPALKVLLDHKIEQNIYQALEKIWAEIFIIDLAKKELSTEEILQLTNNSDGIDITSTNALDPNTRFYDWLSYEIINESPQRCFIPFGSGHLYKNILNTSKNEIASHTQGTDPRFSGKRNILRWCHFLWATTNDPNSLASKLYSPHLPFIDFNEQWLKFYKYAGYCGKKSNVYLIQEKYILDAIDILEGQWVQIEPSASVWLALLLQMKNKIPTDEKILIVSTGKTKI